MKQSFKNSISHIYVERSFRTNNNLMFVILKRNSMRSNSFQYIISQSIFISQNDEYIST